MLLRSTREWAWKAWLAIASLVTAVYFFVPDGPEAKLVLYNGLGLCAVILIAVGARMNGRQRGPWRWFAAGLGSFLIADVLYYVLELTSSDGPPFPSIADFFYLMMYPLVIIGLLSKLRAVSSEHNGRSLIDGLIVAIATFGALWVLFVDVVFDTDQHSFAALLTTLAYPVMDVAILAVATRLAVSINLKHPPTALIVVAVGALAIADTAYGIYNANGDFKTGLFIDAFWLTFYVLFAAASLHPAVAEKASIVLSHERLTVRQLTIMFFATLSVPMIDLMWGLPEDRPVTIAASALLSLLIMLRVFLLMRALEQGQDHLRYAATHDVLSGLANRSLFTENIEKAISEGEGQLAVVSIDLDDFKTVNDSLGHEAGDRFLTEVATRLRSVAREGDTVSRLGGDEFAILLASLRHPQEGEAITRRVIESLDEPIDLGTRTARASASVGVAVADKSDADVETVLRNADVAMYLAKAKGKGRHESFQPAMHTEAVERLDLKADLHRGLEEQQFVLHFQPVFDLKTGKVVTTEALVRWKHPTRGLIMPDRFIPLAEESGIIVPLGAWIMAEACRQAARWNEMSPTKDFSVAVNLSIRQLHDAGLFHCVTRALAESRLDPSNLTLEITESLLATDTKLSAGILSQLKTIGVRLAIDDFGTGYSSLSYLRAFPVDTIKIDRSFINELHNSSTSGALIEAIVNLGRALGASTVAEGIEHSDQAALLTQLGCDRAQGYFYCRPMAPSLLTPLLKQHFREDDEPLESWQRSSELIQRAAFTTGVRRGVPHIDGISADLAELSGELDTPVMGRWPWLRSWCESFSHMTPVLIEVRVVETDHLAATAFLAIAERSEGTTVVAMGHGSSLFTAFQARDEAAAQLLADAIAEMLSEIEGPWSLDLEQVHDLDPTLHRLADLLDNAQTLPELRIPRVVFASAHSVDDVLSRGMRKQLRRAHRRLETEGHEFEIAFDRGAAISRMLIDEVEDIHLHRDRDARRKSDLELPSEREFWRSVVEATNSDWEVEIASLRVNGELAAYVVALLDGGTYRVYDGRMRSDFAAYSPGRLLEAAALARALRDPAFAVLDWMSGVAAEKLLATNIAEGRARLVATSGSRSVFATTRSRRASEFAA